MAISEDLENDIEDSAARKKAYELTHFVPRSQIVSIASACIGICVLALVKSFFDGIFVSFLCSSASASGSVI
jgi:hypothetical protein